MIQFRFSGHETFACRYAWIPKAYNSLKHDASLFSDENKAMVRLGVGKNMVRAIRFWVQLAKVAEAGDKGLKITEFGELIFGENGYDPFLEDIKTLWLIHWNFTTQHLDPMFAWYFMFNKWTTSEFTASEAISAFVQETRKQERSLSEVTLEQHFQVFLQTYYVSRGRNKAVAEDTLDCPLTELRLIQRTGYRFDEDQKRQVEMYSFRRGRKPEITNALLAYCLLDYWQLYRPNESALTFRDISVLPNSVGQIFKLDEMDLLDRLEAMNRDSNIPFDYQASAALPRLVRNCDLKDLSVKHKLLYNIYK